jgi:hypothetical protein
VLFVREKSFSIGFQLNAVERIFDDDWIYDKLPEE